MSQVPAGKLEEKGFSRSDHSRCLRTKRAENLGHRNPFCIPYSYVFLWSLGLFARMLQINALTKVPTTVSSTEGQQRQQRTSNKQKQKQRSKQAKACSKAIANQTTTRTTRTSIGAPKKTSPKPKKTPGGDGSPDAGPFLFPYSAAIRHGCRYGADQGHDGRLSLGRRCGTDPGREENMPKSGRALWENTGS